MAKKTSTPKPASKRGGRRAGAGRKPTKVTELTQRLESVVEGQIGEMVPELVTNLKRLADGGYQRVTETMELASSVMRETIVRDADGNPKLDGRGNVIMASQPAFPDAKVGDLVVTRRVVEVADGDRAANEYLLNRRLGRPRQSVEVSGPDGAPIPLSIEAAIGFIYGEDDPDGSLPCPWAGDDLAALRATRNG